MAVDKRGMNICKMRYELRSYIKHERACLTTLPNAERRVENTTRSRVFWRNTEVFGNVVKHSLECLI